MGFFRSPLLVALLLTFSFEFAAEAGGLKDCALLLQSKLGVSSSRGDGFDVFVVGKPFIKNTHDASLLNRSVNEKMVQFLDQLTALGFSPSSPVRVFIEASPEFIRGGGRLAKTRSPHAVQPISRGVKMSFAEQLLVKSLFPKVGGILPWLNWVMPLRWQKAVIVLTDFDERGFAEMPLVLAHELAHTTQPLNAAPAVMWWEARADLLAYLLTGKTDVLGYRSLSQPKVRSASTLIPDFAKFHENSEIMSSLLYEMGQSFGDHSIVEFIRWADQKFLLPANADDDSPDGRIEDFTEDARYVADSFLNQSAEDSEFTRDVLDGVVWRFGQYLGDWAREQPNRQLQVWLEARLDRFEQTNP